VGFLKKFGKFYKGYLKKVAPVLGPALSLLGPVGGLLGTASKVGGIFSRLAPMANVMGPLLTAGSSMASVASQKREQKKMMRSLMEERTLANQGQEREREEMARKKKQLTDLRRTVGTGRKSLMSGWYDDGSLIGKQTIGA
jgi:hypothetical protein